jgi:purine nucleosidase
MSTRRRLVIDTDPGIDDAIAILLALSSPELEVLAITTVAGNCPLPDCTSNALRVLEFAGRRDIPVHAGCSRPVLRDQVFSRVRGRGRINEAALPPSTAVPREDHAVMKLIALSREARGLGEKLTVCAIGPLTNIAHAISLAPDIVEDWRELVVMGGCFAVPGNHTPHAEFNFLADPHAVRIVLNSGAAVLLMPLDLTHQVMATPARIASIEAAGGRYGRTAARLLASRGPNDLARFGEPGRPMHDPTTVGYLLAPELFAGKSVFVEVDCENPARYGHMIADWHGQTRKSPNATVMTKIDVTGFFTTVAARLAGA